jgi:hypothetical protein
MKPRPTNAGRMNRKSRHVYGILESFGPTQYLAHLSSFWIHKTSFIEIVTRKANPKYPSALCLSELVKEAR